MIQGARNVLVARDKSAAIAYERDVILRMLDRVHASSSALRSVIGLVETKAFGRDEPAYGAGSASSDSSVDKMRYLGELLDQAFATLASCATSLSALTHTLGEVAELNGDLTALHEGVSAEAIRDVPTEIAPSSGIEDVLDELRSLYRGD